MFWRNSGRIKGGRKNPFKAAIPPVLMAHKKKRGWHWGKKRAFSRFAASQASFFPQCQALRGEDLQLAISLNRELLRIYGLPVAGAV
jgi:hypothetical protein